MHPTRFGKRGPYRALYFFPKCDGKLLEAFESKSYVLSLRYDVFSGTRKRAGDQFESYCSSIAMVA